MQIHTIVSHTKFRKARRIGRGGKRGTYSGRGIKGQHARAGAKFRPAERELLKKIPKLRGYRFKVFREKPAIVTLTQLEKYFSEGGTVTPQRLLTLGVIRRIRGKTPRVKILGSGTLTKKLIFKDVIFSKSIRDTLRGT